MKILELDINLSLVEVEVNSLLAETAGSATPTPWSQRCSAPHVLARQHGLPISGRFDHLQVSPQGSAYSNYTLTGPSGNRDPLDLRVTHLLD